MKFRSKPPRIVLEVYELSETKNTTSDTSGNVTYFTGQKIECPYTDKCTKYPSCCGTCKRNTAKKDYYIPDRQDWYIPYVVPPYTWYPDYPIWVSVSYSGNSGECHIYDSC